MSTINVNLAQCDTPHLCAANGGEHVSVCAARPILIPCPIPPSVTFKVVLGECDKRCAYWALSAAPYGKAANGSHHAHHDRCPARPVDVTCSISGETWASSEVTDAWPERNDGYLCSTGKEFPMLLERCRALWALVKALVTGKLMEFNSTDDVKILIRQRDHVFSALCEMARCERAYWASALAIYKALPGVYVSPEMQVVDPGDDDGEAPSARWLAAYVERLIEQVGNL